MAIVSQLCISFPYVLHGLCEDYLTCDIAFNAVMPLSRASTRGRYSRIEGVIAHKSASHNGGSQLAGGIHFFVRNKEALPCVRRYSWWVRAVSSGNVFFLRNTEALSVGPRCQVEESLFCA